MYNQHQLNYSMVTFNSPSLGASYFSESGSDKSHSLHSAQHLHLCRKPLLLLTESRSLAYPKYIFSFLQCSQPDIITIFSESMLIFIHLGYGILCPSLITSYGWTCYLKALLIKYGMRGLSSFYFKFMKNTISNPQYCNI